MEAGISQSEHWLRFVAWLEDNWRRVATVGGAVIVAGIVVAFLVWQGAEKQRNASRELSLLLVGREQPTGNALLVFADAHQGTAAGTRALLLAAGALFREGNYQEAQAQFERFQSQPDAGPWIPKARFGVAASKEALGQTEAAITDYKALVENPGSGNVAPQARFALARLYVKQGQTELARAQYEELASMPGVSLSSEARLRLAELPAAPAALQMEIPVVSPAPASTNQP